jgi:hypothetical protein
MKPAIISAMLLSACTAAPYKDWCDQPRKDLWTQRCDRDTVARPAPEKPPVDKPTPEKPPVEKPTEPEKPSGLEPNRETDPQGWRDWKDNREQDQ